MGLLDQYLMLAPYLNRNVQPGQTGFPKPYQGPRGAGGMPSANPSLPGVQTPSQIPMGGAGLLGGMNFNGAPNALNASNGLGALIMGAGVDLGGMYDLSQGMGGLLSGGIGAGPIAAGF